MKGSKTKHDTLEQLRGDLSIPRRMAAATVGALLVSVIVTPFDVVRVRLQQQIRTTAPAVDCVPTTESCLREHFRRWDGHSDSWCDSCGVPRTSKMRFEGSVDAAVKLVRYEGPSSLWRGLSASLLLSIPATVLYFGIYDKLKDHLVYKQVPLAPLWAGTIGRSVTMGVVSPLELIRTKHQSMSHGTTIRRTVAEELAKPNGFRNLWRGITPTLWRDVPFSAVYWTCYETFKGYMVYYRDKWRPEQKQHSRETLILSSFVAGALGGVIAATITQPFYLVKKRRHT
jgi:solute carrier family 25 protein 39/40